MTHCFYWWAVLGSNQWPLPCETGVLGLRINHMRVLMPVATGTWYHVMSFDITQCHERGVPELSQTRQSRPTATASSRCFSSYTIRVEAPLAGSMAPRIPLPANHLVLVR
jgi:hypothetical protein